MKTIIAIGGGELRQKETRQIDAYIASLAIKRAGDMRANALFIPTASHDSLPYFNTFRKTYTSDYGLKADVALLTKKDIPMQKIAEKFAAADMLYVGGGNTKFMLDIWRQTGVDKLILEAYHRGVIVAGLSAGAIFMFEKMYTDSYCADSGTSYSVATGLSVLNGLITPHYNERREEFLKVFNNAAEDTAFALENNSAVVFNDGALVGSLSSGGAAYIIKRENSVATETVIQTLG